MAKIDYWNDKKGVSKEEDLRELMSRSESGRKLLEKRNADIAKREKEKRDECTMRGAFLSLINGKRPAAGIRSVDRAGEEIVAGSGLQPGFGLHIPLESRYISDQTTPIATFIAKYNKAIRDRLVLSRLGATLKTGVVGRSILPTYTGSTVSWGGETDTAINGKGTFSKKELKPKRISAKLTVSRMLLAQNDDADDYLTTDITEAVVSALEAAVLGKHDHVDYKPDGFFTGKDIIPLESNTGSLLNLEGSIRANGEPMAYCMRSNVERLLKITPRGQSTAVYGGRCNDYDYVSTDTVPAFGDNEEAGGIIFGRWSDLFIAQWGAIEILYNPYTKASDGEIEFTVNAFYDFTYRPESFAIAAIR